MARKPNMTVTTRSLGEKRPIAAKQIPSPFPNPPPNRQPIPRLAFHGPSPKLDCSIEKLTDAIKVAALPDAILFLDTNVFTKELDLSAWDALFSRRILITPRVWKELRPWLKTPFITSPYEIVSSQPFGTRHARHKIHRRFSRLLKGLR
jgi:hypothetical protein